jgi:DNA-binding transcriptional MerR regulator
MKEVRETMLTVGKIAEKYGLSRTALLYYDKLGLVSPSARGENGYRFYNEADEARLGQVLIYRGVGVPLQNITGLIAGGDDKVHALLLRRLSELGEELVAVRNRQLAVIGMIAENQKTRGALDHNALTRVLRGAGIDPAGAKALHQNLESSSPEAHRAFLAALGFKKPEIREIQRRYAAKGELDHEKGEV